MPAATQQQDEELEAIVELPRLDEDYCAELVTTTVTAFGAAPFSFHAAATPALWCDPGGSTMTAQLAARGLRDRNPDRAPRK